MMWFNMFGNRYDVISSEELNISIETDVLDSIVEDIDDILDDIEAIQLLKKMGIDMRVQYIVDKSLWETETFI